jgi:hypothetical protein
MFDFKDAFETITIDEIFSKVSEYELWKYYCSNFNKIDEPFLSELYNDNNPSCRIYRANNNKLVYKDFGTGEHYDIFSYIQVKHLCNFKDCLYIIARDFKIRSTVHTTVDRQLLVRESMTKSRTKSTIDIVSQPFNMIDFNYWNQYSIPLTLLREYDVFSCKFVYLRSGNKIYTFSYQKNDPVYAYRFVSNNEYHYKVYRPYSSDKRYKWLFSGSSKNDIEGYNQLSLTSKTLIITKSLKDVMIYRLLSIDAISLQGEANRLDEDIYNELSRRFDNIIVNYDDDNAGNSGVLRLYNQYGLKHFFIDDHKDVSDYVKENGLDKAKEMINNKLHECTKKSII